MSILSGAVSGLGEGMMATGKFVGEAALNEQRADLELKKQQALKEFESKLAVDAANQQRQAQVDRVSAAQNSIVGNLRAAKANAFYGDGQNLTDADLSDEEKAAFAPTDKESQDARTKAAIQTGDISPKDAATLADKADMAAMKAENYQNRTEMMKELAQIRADATVQAMQLRLDAAQQKATTGKIDTATGRMLITSEDANIKAATSQLNMLSRQLSDPMTKKEQSPGIEAQMEELRGDIKISQATKNMYMKQLGFPTSDEVTKTAPSSPAIVPGARGQNSAPRPPLSSFVK